MNLFFLSGLPRTGSTLLTSILSQNPDIHSEGNSGLCQIMWDTHISCEVNCSEQLMASNKVNTQFDIISNLPYLYYKDVTAKYVVDKCRTWTLPSNMDLIYDFVNLKPKIIVLLRPIDEILKSFLYLNQNNDESAHYKHLLDPDSITLMLPYDGVLNAMKNNSGEFLFITYDELVNDTKETLRKIYEFCEWDPFEHDLSHIVNKFPEDDSVYGVVGQHDVRPTIGKREYSIKLSEETLKKCRQLNRQIGF